MNGNNQLIITFRFKESEDFPERVSSSLDIILKDLHSKGLLDEKVYGNSLSQEK